MPQLNLNQMTPQFIDFFLFKYPSCNLLQCTMYIVFVSQRPNTLAHLYGNNVSLKSVVLTLQKWAHTNRKNGSTVLLK